MKQNRFKSKVTWAAIASAVLTILVATDIINVTESEAVENLVVVFLNVLTTFGVLNNPTDKESF